MSTRALRVAIIGGGIGGLAAASALLLRGIKVQVYEQAAALTEVGAGIALQPNGLRILRRMGFSREINQWGAQWKDPQFRRTDGAFIARMWPSNLVHPVEIYGIHRADLLNTLVSSLPSGVIKLDHRCIGFEQNKGQAVVAFANGVEAAADVVVAADGIHSTLLQYVVAPSAPISSGSTAYRGLVSAENVDWPAGAMRNWLGAGKHFLVYPVRAGQLLNFVGFVPSDVLTQESWSAPGDPIALAEAFAGWDPLVEEIIAQVETTFRWGLYDREPLASWTNGRLALLGDAAHPMLPHLGQGANQAIEDGIALATILSLADRDTAPQALLAYESLRRERTAQVQRNARVNGARYDASEHDLSSRDGHMAAQASERSWIWDYDAEASAVAVIGR